QGPRGPAVVPGGPFSGGLLADELGHRPGVAAQRRAHVLGDLGGAARDGGGEPLVEGVDVAVAPAAVAGPEVEPGLVDLLETPHGAVGALGHTHELLERDGFGSGEGVLAAGVVADERGDGG